MKYFSTFFALLFCLALIACPQSSELDTETAEEAAEKASAQSEIVGEEVTYISGGTNLKGYVAYDKSIEGKRPGILVVHEWWGHNDYARKRAEDLAKLGYTALAVDMYGDGKNTTHPEDANKFMTEALSNIPVAEARFQAAMKQLQVLPTVDRERIGAIGYCFGGAVVLHMARAGMDLDGVASFHGVLKPMTTAEPGSIKAKIFVAHAGNDKLVPLEQVKAFKSEMDAANADYSLIVYEGVDHSFTNPAADNYKGTLPLSYNAEADAKSWKAMKEFFNKIFGS